MSEVFDLSAERAMRTMNSAMKLYALEYSVKENTTHLRTWENVLKDNIHNVRNGQSKDYLPVGVFHSREEAERFRIQLLLILEENQPEVGGLDWKRIADCLEEALERFLSPN
jgi:hypothetical protein